MISCNPKSRARNKSKRKKSFVTVTDLFCGAGGSSDGARQAGAEVVMAVNHWNKAIETHSSNFPDTEHDLTDIHGCDPNRYERTDILIASPECTKHSVAAGLPQQNIQLSLWDEEEEPDPLVERSRATMLDVVKFAARHEYEIIIIENVVEVTRWVKYEKWLEEMTSLGYRYRQLSLNSQFFYPCPQSRDRLYVVFWRVGNKAPDLDFYPRAYCPKCEKDTYAVQSFKNPKQKVGKYGKNRQYWYRCSLCAEVVPPYYFCAATAIDWTTPAERIGDRKKPLKPKTMERIEAGLKKFGQAALMGMGANQHGREYPLWQAWPTQTATPTFGLAQLRPGQISSPTQPPFLVGLEHSEARSGYIKDVTEAYPTQTLAQGWGVVVPPRTLPVPPTPFLVETSYSHAGNGRTRGLSEALTTQTAQPSLGLVVSPASTFVGALRKNDTGHALHETLPTACAGANHYYLITGGSSTAAEGTQTQHLQAENAPTTYPAPFILGYYSNDQGHPVTEPIGTVTSLARHALIMSYYSRNDATRPATEPIGTVTTEPRHALLQIGKQSPQPTTSDRDKAIEDKAPAELEIENVGFRMLTPKEVQAAMSFRPDYLIKGNNREKVKQLGQAVTPPVMKWIIKRCVTTLAG